MPHVDAMAELGERLTRERKRLGFSQAETAVIGGVGRSAQSRYENGLSTPSATYLQAFSEAGGDILYVVTGGIPSAAEASVQAANVMVELAERMRPPQGQPIDTEGLYGWIAGLTQCQLTALTTLLINKALLAEFNDNTEESRD